MRLAILAAIALAAPAPALAADPPKRDIDLVSEHTRILGLPLPESEKPVYRITLTAKVDAKGEGDGLLVLDPTAPAYDELGSPAPATALPPVKLECSLKHVKTLTVKVFPRQRLGAPPAELQPMNVEWKLYSITGPKITSRLFLATPQGGWGSRLLVHDDKEKVKYVVDLRLPPQPEPCHPGCFPAGTPVLLPDGTTTAVEGIRAGDVVATVAAGGTVAKRPVESVFVTTNKLIEVKTAAGALVTTETQPLVLVGGELRAAGELKAGDKVWRWDGKERRATEVTSVTATGRQEWVYNLILKDQAVFVAGGFLARSKPPAVEPVQP